MDAIQADDDDDHDLDFSEEPYIKDHSDKVIMIKREVTAAAATPKRLQALINNHHIIMEETAAQHDQKKKAAAGSTTSNNIGGKKGPSAAGGCGGSGGGSMKCCQAEKCTADLTDAKQYHRRHKVCEYHAKAQVVIVGGIRQRFCQQCSRFHELSEFDESKRSCRRRLAGHNERRRKSTAETASTSLAEGGGGGGGTAGGKGHQANKEMVCGEVDDHHRAGRIQLTIQENSTNYKHFQQFR